MKICHVAIYTRKLEELKDFYAKYFNGKVNQLYVNKEKGFSSYFIEFDSDTNLELMSSVNCHDMAHDEFETGLSHLAFSVGDVPAVQELTEKLMKDGYTLVRGPRITGDGYYESCVLDPDGNAVEITI
jgi:catechol 2,3-dioxygenase-like lactoylglutathione lyase family enzyme